MCGRYYLLNPEKIFSRYGIDKSETIDFKPNYNITPGKELPIVVVDSKGKHVRLVRWGLVPFWAKDPKIGYKFINARVETLAEKPSFKKPLVSQRAIIPASGFFEWKKEGKEKIPFLIHSKKENIISFAGLYDVWKDKKGTLIPTFTIITTAADKNMEQIHDRMPIILEKEIENDWLNPEVHDPNFLEDLLMKNTEQNLESYRVSDEINKPKNNRKELLAQI